MLMKSIHKTIRFTVMLMTMALYLQACSKYEEGPKISLYSKKHRVVGTWTVFVHDVDDISIFNEVMTSKGELSCNNQMQKVQYRNTKRNAFYSWKFEKTSYSYNEEFVYKSVDQYNSAKLCFPLYKENSTFLTENGSWEFSDDKMKIILKPKSGATKTYDIKELSHNQIHIVGTVQGKKHDITLTRDN